MSKQRLAFLGSVPNPEILKHYFPSGDYVQKSSGYSCRVEDSRYCISWSHEYMGPGLMNIIGCTKAHVRKRVRDGVIQAVAWEPKFQSTSRLIQNCEAVELDLSAAYLSAALKLGVVSEKIGAWIKRCAKRNRLKIVGSLGTTTTVTDFRVHRPAGFTMHRDKDTGFAWDQIVREVDRTMWELAETAGGDFLFYWTDAVFAKADSILTRKRIIAAAKDRGYDVKVRLVRIKVKGSKILASDGRAFPVQMEGGSADVEGRFRAAQGETIRALA